MNSHPSCTKCNTETVHVISWEGETCYRCPRCRAEYWYLAGKLVDYPKPRKPGRAGRVH